MGSGDRAATPSRHADSSRGAFSIRSDGFSSSFHAVGILQHDYRPRWRSAAPCVDRGSHASFGSANAPPPGCAVCARTVRYLLIVPRGDPPAIRTRPATLDDLDALVTLLGQLHPDFPTDHGRAYGVLASMLDQPGRTVLVAQAGGTIVGTADLLIVPNLTHDASPWAIVENFVVDQRSRRRGVGRALLVDIFTQADDAGCYMIQLVSLNHRTDAHAFYQRHGFEPLAEGLRKYLNGYYATGRG